MKKRTKYIPTIKFNKYAYIALALFFAFLLLWLQRQKNGGLKLWDTMVMLGNYNQSVDLSAEQISWYENEIQTYDDLISSFMSGTGAVVRGNTQQERFLKKAQNLNLLGQNNKAIKTLIGAFKYYPESPYIMDLLATIYAKAGAYQRALDLFEKLVILVPESKMGYAKPIMEMYVKLGDADKAGKLYIQYISDGWAEDSALINQIREARGLAPLK